MLNECKICNIMEEDGCEPFDKPILETESFRILAGMGQICDGYLIVCAKRHIVNLMQLEDEEWNEFRAIKKLLREMIYDTYQIVPWYFEHGDSSSGLRGGSCIAHAHLHVIPLPLNQLPAFLKKFEMIDFSISNDYREQLREMTPYFYIELADGSKRATTQVGLPCQFGRKLIVAEYKLPFNWDWRVEPMVEKMYKCIEEYSITLKTRLDSYKRDFPEARIRY